MKKLIKSLKNFVNSSKDNKKSRSLLMSAFSSVLLLLSVTFAWFVSTINLEGNEISTGTLGFVAKGYDQQGNFVTTLLDEESEHDLTNPNIQQLKNPLFKIDNWGAGQYQTAYISIEMTGSLDMDYELTFNVDGEEKDIKNIGAFWYRVTEIDNSDLLYQYATNMSGGSLGVNATAIEKNYSEVIKRYIANAKTIVPCTEANCLKENGTTKHTCTEYSDNAVANMVTINRNSTRGKLEKVANTNNHRRILRVDVGVCGDAIASRYTDTTFTITGKIFGTQKGAIDNPDGMGRSYYATDPDSLKELIYDAVPGDNIIINSNIEYNGDLIINKCVNIYTNGRNLTINGNLVYDFVSKHTLHIDMNSGGNIYVKSKDGFGGDVQFNTPNSEVNISSISFMGNLYVEDEVKVNATRAYETDGFEISGTNILTLTGESQTFVVSSDTRLTINKGCSVYRISSARQTTNIEVVNYGTIREIDLSTMLLVDENPTSNYDTNHAQILINNHNIIINSIILPGWSRPFISSNDVYTGNTKIIRQWGASELSIDANSCTTFTKEDITDYNVFDLSVEQLNGSDSELIINYHDDEDEDGNIVENTIQGLLTTYFEERLNTTGAEVTNAIENIMTLVVRTTNNKVVTVTDLNFMNTNMIRLSKLDLDLATLANHTLPANQFKNKTVLQEIILPRNIEKIGTSALQGTKIQHISIPASILRIENSAFTGIRFATFEGSTCPEVFNGRNHGILYMFIDEAYIESFKTKMYGNDEKNRVYPKAEIADDGFTAIRQVSDGYEIVLYVGEDSDIVVGDNVYLNGERVNITSVNAYAYRHITRNITLTFNASVVRLGTNAFRGSQITELDTNQIRLIGDNAFYDCKLLQKVVLSNVDSIGVYSFYNCTGLTDLDLGTTKTVGKYAFSNCSGLLTLNTKEVTFVDEYAFNGCSKIVILELPNLKEISFRSFYSCGSVTSITFGSIETVAKESFQHSTKVREIYILNESVDNLTGLNVFSINETNQNHDLHVYAREEIVATVRSKTNFSNRVVPLGSKYGENIVTVNGMDINLGEYIVSGTPDHGIISVCKQTEYIDSVLEIPETLTCVNEDGTTTTYVVKEIYQYAFYRVTLEQETKIIFPDSLKTIGTYAFRNNNDSSGNAKNIVEIDFGGTEKIDNYAFDNCFYLTRFNNDNNIKNLGSYVFQNCYSLVEVCLPNIESFVTDSNGYTYCFTAATSMIKFETGEKLTGKIGGSPVRGATKLRQFIFRTNQVDTISFVSDLNQGMTIHPNLKVYFSEEVVNSTLISNSRLNNFRDYIRKCGEISGTYEIEVTTNYGKTLTVDIGAYTYSEVQLSDSESTSGISLHGVNFDVEDYTYDRLSISEINGQPIVLLDYQCFRVTNFGDVERKGQAKENYSIPETVKELAANAFYGNATIRFSNLKNVEIVRASAMQNCTNIYMMDAPELRIVYASAFNGMSNILKFNAPKLYEIAGASAFSSCPKMVSLITAVEKVYDVNAQWWDRTSLQELIVNTNEETSSTYKPKLENTVEMIMVGSSKNVNTNINTNHRVYSDVKKVGTNIIEATDDDGTVIYSFDLGQYYINATGDEVTIYKYLSPYVYEDLYIPSQLDGRDVTRIGRFAFYSVDFQSNSLYLPNTVTAIENQTFKASNIGGTLNLNKVTSLGADAFYTNKIVRVNAPLVTALSNYAFYNNTLLEEVYAPSCTSIGSLTFYGCSSLNVLRFSYLPSVNDRSIPNTRNITVILEGVIDATHALPTEATIARWKNTSYVPYQPAKNTFLVPYLHLEEYKTTNLDNYYIMKHYGTVFDINSETYVLEDLGDSWKILSLITTKDTVVIPESYNGKNITHIDSNAFISASSVKNITLPRYYSYFEDLAFNNAVSLENISVDANNTKFTAVNGVLYSKDMKELIYYPSKKSDETFTISNDVYVIRSYAFAGNDYLKNLVVGSNVMVLSSNAFEGTLLISIEFTGTTIPYATSSNIFDSNNDSLTIYVPASALEAYQGVNAFQIYTIVGK